MTGKTLGVTESKKLFEMKNYKWEFDDDDDCDRKTIQEWSRNRVHKMRGLRKSYVSFLVYSFHISTLKSFIENFNFMVILQMVIAVCAVWLFDTYDIYFNFHIGLFVSPIVFPLAFSINTDFQRREKVLDDLANFKSSSMVFFFCMREWREAAGLDEMWLNNIKKKIHSIMFNLREYLLTEKEKRREIIARMMYEDFSDISQLVEKVRASKLPANTSIVSRIIHLINALTLSFERLRVIREYRSPRSIRSFNKVLILLLPIILCPYFVYLGRIRTTEVSVGKWGPYYIAVLVAAVFGALQGVQDKLDDPFDGMSEDDINLDTIDEWTFNSLQSAADRNYYTIGRFHVQANIDHIDHNKQTPRSKSIVQMIQTLEAEEGGLGLSKENIAPTKSSKSPFANRKSAKSLFRRSAKGPRSGSKKRAAVIRSQTFGGVDVTGDRRSRYSSSTSQAFTPEDHPFAEVLENMSGDCRIERKHTVRHNPLFARQMSHDVPSLSVPMATCTKPKSMSDASLHHTTSKEVVIDLESPTDRKSVGVSFLPEPELFTYSQNSPDLPRSGDKQSKQPLLSEDENNIVYAPHVDTNNARFTTARVNSIPEQMELEDKKSKDHMVMLNNHRFHTSPAKTDDGSLQQVVINGNDDNVFS